MTDRTGHEVSLHGTDVRFACAEGDTLLRAALRAGVGLSYECNSGSCGSCRYELLDGEMHDRRPDAPGLTARDRRKQRRLACQSEPRSACTVRVGATTEPAPHRPVRQWAALREVNPLTHDMAEFVFTTGQPAAFSPGQYAMVLLPDGGVERAYSMSNVGNCYGEWRFVVKRTPDGRATSLLFDKLEVGATVGLDGPYGHAYLRRDNPKIVCVGGGSGVGAMISIVLGAAALPDAADRSVHLFLGGRTADDLFLPSALELAAPRLGALHFHTAVSGAPETGAEACRPESDAYRGFVHEAVIDVLGDDLTDYTYYAAGPPAMTDALARSLVLEGGLDADRLHFDRFC
ncbi:oxidoreductase [Streptomyces sp. Ru73]|uniref:2Fe-2S iron-sulfur cluster-binding protein n=1 Tax=Streptomyces sp. Ru73 TaxID=2080748 RepID=UPI000CDCE3DE|nr:2Fe-2S iron-sulfur cluster binding domain-containing protein [Streptomyces sp. Ru73]POX38570.1 oxidoreductase [Streptomyces sp. Ru73]